MTLDRFTSRTRDDCLEITCEVDAVTPSFLQQLCGKLLAVTEAEQTQSPKALIEVIAPASEMTLLERFRAWERTLPLVRKMRVAYVVTGRPLSSDVSFFELVAHNRGVTLKFFGDRGEAVRWLGAPAGREVDAQRGAPDKH